MKKGNGLQTLLIVFFVALIGFSGWKLYGIYAEYNKGTEAYGELAEQYVSVETAAVKLDAEESKENSESETVAEEMISVDVAALRKTYPDVVGWIYCPGTAINYPIVKGKDNDYYLHRLMNGEYSLGGTLFMDYRNAGDFSGWNNIVYGHNMKNGSMLAVLTEYYEQEFYEKHPVWYLFTEECDYRIELVGGYTTPADSNTYSFPESADAKEVLVKKADRSSTFESGIQVGEDERLITFSTCVYDYENARYVLVGVLRNMEKLED